MRCKSSTHSFIHQGSTNWAHTLTPSTINLGIQKNFFLIISFIYGCAGFSLLCMGFSPVVVSYNQRGSFLAAGCGPLIVVASVVMEHGLQRARTSVAVTHRLRMCRTRALEHRLDSCDAQAQLFQHKCNLPRPGIELMSPALAGRFFTTEPPGKPQK